jgi:hypothetical protein
MILVSVKYRQIENHFGHGKEKNVKIKYMLRKRTARGIIGAGSKLKIFEHDYI